MLPTGSPYRLDGQRRVRHERDVPGERFPGLPFQTHRNGQAGRRAEKAVDSALERLQALPLTAKIREAVSKTADFILTMDFPREAAEVNVLLGGKR
jgi:hypothetical protein